MKNLIALSFCLLLSILSIAQIPEPRHGTYINDFANVLRDDEIYKLNQSLRELETKTSIQVAIVTITTLPVDVTIDQYAIQLARKWRVGNARNGLVYVTSINDHKHRLEVAGHLEGTIPDYQAKQIIDLAKSSYRNREYYEGINTIISKISRTVHPVEGEQKALGNAELKKKNDNSGIPFWVYLSVIAFVSIAGYIWIQSRRRKQREERERIQKDVDKNYQQSLYNAGRIAKTNNPRPVFNNPSQYKKKRDEGFASGLGTGYIAGSLSNDYDSSSSSSSSSSDSSSSSSSSSYGDWGSGSSDNSSSSDSGFSGGGSSSDW